MESMRVVDILMDDVDAVERIVMLAADMERMPSKHIVVGRKHRNRLAPNYQSVVLVAVVVLVGADPRQTWPRHWLHTVEDVVEEDVVVVVVQIQTDRAEDVDIPVRTGVEYVVHILRLDAVVLVDVVDQPVLHW